MTTTEVKADAAAAESGKPATSKNTGQTGALAASNTPKPHWKDQRVAEQRTRATRRPRRDPAPGDRWRRQAPQALPPHPPKRRWTDGPPLALTIDDS
jgi:hypothetical protein